MYRVAITSLCLMTAAPAFAGDLALTLHSSAPIVGSFTTPINYRPHNAAGDNYGRGFVEAEIIRSSGYSEANTKVLPRTRSGAGSIESEGPVTEIFVENLPVLK